VLAESAFRGKHQPKLAEALEDARRRRYAVLLVWALDRVSREGIEAMLLTARQFRDRGVRVLSLQEPWTDGPQEMQELLGATLDLLTAPGLWQSVPHATGAHHASNAKQLNAALTKVANEATPK